MDRFAGLVGIDLGTTLCCVGHLARDGIPTTVPNREGDLLTPSVILIDDSGIVVGKEAKRTECVLPDRTAVCVKRDMGSRYYSKQLGGQWYRPEVLSAMILRRLKDDVEVRLWPVKHAVITVPAYFDDLRRKATQDAARIAGLPVLDIINEPTAAALSYAFMTHVRREGSAEDFEGFTRKPMTALVYDLGGGTFDVSLVRITPTSFETLATDGDVLLGGRDWDQRLVAYASDAFKRQYNSDPRDDAESLAMLSLAAEQAKHALSTRMSTRLLVTHDGHRLPMEITRPLFEDLTADLLTRTRTTSELVVDAAGLTWQDVDRVLLVGGMTRIPSVREMLRDLSGREPDGSLAADEVVAHGAAIHGGILISKGMAEGEIPELTQWRNFTTVDVTAHSLGVSVRNANGTYSNSIVIPKNTRLPHARTRVFYTVSADQRQVRIRVLQGEAPDADACVQIGEFLLSGLPAGLPDRTPIEVECKYETDGRISVLGREPQSGKLAQTTILRAEGLEDEELNEAAVLLQGMSVG